VRPLPHAGPHAGEAGEAYGGRFTLAKLNSDEVPEIATQLSQMFGVRSIPFCVMFVDGQPVDGFVGALPEAQIREFLDKHVPAGEALAAEAEVQEAEGLLAEGDTEAALAKLVHAVQTDPANETARFDLVKALLEAGQVAHARAAFDPVAAQAADTITPHPRFAALAVWLAAAEAPPADTAALQAAIAANKRDFDARYAGAVAAGRPALHRRDGRAAGNHHARQDLARPGGPQGLCGHPGAADQAGAQAAAEAKTGTLEIAGKSAAVQSDPLIDQYRRKLSMALF
jgi:putative thioredoxin